MPGNPNLRAASVHPFHRSGAITDVPRPDGRIADVQRRQAGDGEQVPGRPVQAIQPVLGAELADFLWRRPEPVLEVSPSSAAGRSGAPDSGICRDPLLAEIEDLAGNLKGKVARYSSLQAGQSSAQAAESANETAVGWIQDALEDIAATALGIEIASRELFLRAASAGEQKANEAHSE